MHEVTPFPPTINCFSWRRPRAPGFWTQERRNQKGKWNTVQEAHSPINKPCTHCGSRRHKPSLPIEAWSQNSAPMASSSWHSFLTPLPCSKRSMSMARCSSTSKWTSEARVCHSAEWSEGLNFDSANVTANCNLIQKKSSRKTLGTLYWQLLDQLILWKTVSNRVTAVRAIKKKGLKDVSFLFDCKRGGIHCFLHAYHCKSKGH